MYKIKRRTGIVLFIIVLFLFSSIAFATDFSETEVEHDFNTNSFLFAYNDHNTTVYEGDSGLKGAYANSTIDNYTYYFTKDDVRGVAYATKKSFKFSEDIIITRSLHSSTADRDYIVLTMKFKNGTTIPSLRVQDDLTTEQKSYFDNYEDERDEYYQKQYRDELDDLYNSYEIEQAKSKSKNKYSYYYGSNGYGFVYTS